MTLPLRVLVVDDTAVFRRVVSDAFAALPDVEVVGVATNGRAALARIEELRPDLVSLDIEMPEMNGVEVLEALKALHSDVGVLVLSSLTRKGGELTMKALDLGAFDFVTKPTTGSPEQNRIFLGGELGPRIRAFARRREIQKLLGNSAVPRPAPPPPPPPRPSSGPPVRPEMVLVGVSTGGPTALATVLPQLPAGFPVPVLVVQHMPPLFTGSLAASLAAKCRLAVKEGKDGEAALPGTIYLAPGGSHMKLVAENGGEKRIRITDEPPENHCKPAVDVLFRSVANAFPGRATAVILTGMGCDGTLGCRLLKRHGGTIIAQDESSCVVFGMPKEAIQAGVVDVVAPLERIAEEIVRSLRGLP
jgi:two-component system chemotaxis response regulator CheB